jgi:hypothetical protein
MGIRLWLDDERDPKDRYVKSHFGSDGEEVWVKTAQQAISRLRQNDVESMSLDHDLGPGAGTGYDVAKWIEEQAFLGTLPRLTWFVHSLNIVGRLEMTRALTKADEYWDRDG